MERNSTLRLGIRKVSFTLVFIETTLFMLGKKMGCFLTAYCVT